MKRILGFKLQAVYKTHLIYESVLNVNWLTLISGYVKIHLGNQIIQGMWNKINPKTGTKWKILNLVTSDGLILFMKTADVHFPTSTKIKCTDKFDSLLSSLVPTAMSIWPLVGTGWLLQWQDKERTGDWKLDGGLQNHSWGFDIPDIHKVLPLSELAWAWECLKGYDKTLYNHHRCRHESPVIQMYMVATYQIKSWFPKEQWLVVKDFKLLSTLCSTENKVHVLWTGPSLVRDEASVVLTGIIQTTKRIRVMDHNKMLVLLVTQNKITNGTRKNNGFQLSYESFGKWTYPKYPQESILNF